MLTLRTGALIASSFALVFLAGCGVELDITGGQNGAFQVKVTNVSACPLADFDDDEGGANLAFVPYLPAAVVEESEFLALACGVGGQPPPAMSTQLAGAGEFPLDAARLQVASLQQLAAAATCSGSGVTCESQDEGVACVIEGTLNAGDMRTLTCQATPPAGPGPFYTLAFSSLEADGVCKAGANQGQACDEDDDCAGVDSCGDGICSGGTNDGLGCDADGDCGGGTCVDCNDGGGLGLACLAAAGPAPAPALAPAGLAGALAALAGLAYWRLRRRA